MEGTRPILVEVQALTSATTFAQPRRTANGVDFNRLLLITAVLSKRARVRLADQDIFVNVVGGLQVDEPAADLAIAVAIASSARNRPVAADLALVGEVGLSGELRSVGQLPRRLNEAAKLGFTRVLVPKTVARKLEHPPAGLEVLGARTLREALEIALVGGGRGGGAGELRERGSRVFIAIICHLWYNTRMEFAELVEIVGDEPVFETGLLLAGDVNPADVRRQLSRWTQAGRLYQLRRGLYALAPPFQKVKPHPFLVANRLVRGSYVSCQSALAYYGLIPEYMPVTTSVTTGARRPWDTPLGSYEFRHIQIKLLHGYRLIEVGGGQRAFVATPEKALLDLVYLQPGGDAPDYLRELRLQNLDRLNLAELDRLAERIGSPKLQRAAAHVRKLAQSEADGVRGAMKEYLSQLVRAAPTPAHGRNAAREYLQARILGALQRAGAMIPLAFHGGTALRFLYASPRYSEDLDFALEQAREQLRLPCLSQGRSIGLDRRRLRRGAQGERPEGRAQRLCPLRRAALRAGAVAAPRRSAGRQDRGGHEPTGRGRTGDHRGPPPRDPAAPAPRPGLAAGGQAARHPAATLPQRPRPLRPAVVSERSRLARPNLTLLNNALRQTGWPGPELTEGNWREAVRERLQALAWDQVVADVRPFLEPGADAGLLTLENVLRVLG